jgi:hypothetical protein
MSDNVFEQLEDESPRFRAKLETNQDLCNVLIALLGRIILVSQSFGRGVNAARLGPVSEYGNGEFRMSLFYLTTTLVTPISVTRKSALRDYMFAKQISLARVLSVNPQIADRFQELIEQIDRWATHKRIPFCDLKVITGGAFISRDLDVVIRVAKEDTTVARHRAFNG